MNIDDVEIVEFSDENGKVRMFVVDGAMQSATYIDKDRRNDLNFEYMRRFAELSTLHPDAKDVLMIGAGMFSYPKYLIAHDPEVRVDALDPDEDMYDYACTYFYLDELIAEYDLEHSDRLSFIADDGRHYLQTEEKKYDIILNDAFNGFEPAADLCTLEACRLIQKRLKEGGMYLCNVPGYAEAEESLFLKGCMRTLKEVFPHVLAVKAKKDVQEGASMNYIIIASGFMETCGQEIPVNTDDAPVFEDHNTDAVFDCVDWL